jgi:hypothetical protein
MKGLTHEKHHQLRESLSGSPHPSQARFHCTHNYCTVHLAALAVFVIFKGAQAGDIWLRAPGVRGFYTNQT